MRRGCFAAGALVLSLTIPRLVASGADASPAERAQILNDVRFSGESAISVFAKDAVLLGTIEVESEPTPLLIRELGRQALLVAAREGLGLATRDRTLRESFGSEAPGVGRPVEMAVFRGKGRQVVFVAFRRNGEAIEPMWREEVSWKEDQNPLEEVARACETFARGPLVKVLTDAGYAAQAPAAPRTGPVPEGAIAPLDRMDVVSQYGALRLLHSEIRKSGESTARLCAVSLAYAQLGTMLERCQGPAHKAYKARALLYAERALARSSGGAAELWNRGRVRALLGIHASALKDVEAARTASRGKTPPMADPDWAGAVEAACQFDEARLSEQGVRPGTKRVAAYLSLLTAEFSQSDKRVSAAATTCLEVHPECLRAVDTLATLGALGPVRQSASQSLSVFKQSFYPRAAQLPGIPANLRTEAETLGKAAKESFEARNTFLDHLEAAGSLARDRAEPSLAAVAQTGRELGFVQASYGVRAASELGTPLRQPLSLFDALLERHPYGAIVESYALDDASMKAQAGELAKRLDPPSVETSSVGLIEHLYRFNKQIWVPWLRRAFGHTDDTARDLYQATQVMRTDDAGRAEFERFRLVSPHAPPVVAYGLRKDWKALAPQAAELERRYKDNPVILRAMAEKLEEADDLDGAARCFQRCLEIDPEVELFFELAELYARQKKDAEWKATLEKVLKIPVEGLEHAEARNQIARHHIGKKEYKEALPYAQAAAKSEANWALQTLAECHEHLGSWKDAEAVIIKLSQHYETESVTWFFWCHRTGRGNESAARRQAERYFASQPKPLSPEMQQYFAAFNLLAKKKEDALKALEASFKANFDPFTGLHAAVLADELRKNELRDSLLSTTLQKGATTYIKGRRMMLMVKLAEQYSAAIAKRKGDPKATLDTKQLDGERRRANPGENTQVDYLLGRILTQYGTVNSSREFSLSAATSPDYGYASFLAAASLREAKVTIGPRRAKEFEFDAAAPADVDPERRAAEFVVGKKASVVVTYIKRGPISVGSPSKLPIPEAPPFTVKEISFFGIEVKEDELKNLAGLSRIESLTMTKPIGGTGFKDIGSLPTLKTLSLNARKLTDESLEAISHFGALDSLFLQDSAPQITARGCGHLAALSQLRRLAMDDTSDANLAPIGRLTSLKSLFLGDYNGKLPNVTDAGLAHLGHLKNLTQLEIRRASITDDGLKHLAPLAALSELQIYRCKVTGEGLKHVPAGKLTSLSLDFSEVTEAGVRTIARFPNLQRLSLSETAVTESGLLALRDMKSLKQVTVRNTKLTAENLETLSKAMPNCKFSK